MRNFFFIYLFLLIFFLCVPNLWGGSNSSEDKGGQSVLPMAESAKNGNATQSYKMEEMEVSATHLKGSVSAFMEEEKASPEVVDALSAEQMSKAGDTYVSEALRRLPGISLVDSKYVYVRGLGERYSSVLFNGARLPSTDPTRKVIELDLFPSDVLSGAVVQKSYSPDVPASFAGGTVMLRPKSYPQEFFASISAEAGYNTETTFEDGYTYDGGDTDFLGIDDDTRELPDSVPSDLSSEEITPEEREAIGEDFESTYDIDEEKSPINHTFNFSMGDQYRTGLNSYGYLASVRYSQDWQTVERKWRTFNKQGEKVNDMNQKWTDRDIDLSAFLNVGAEFGTNHKLSSTTMLLRRTTDTAKLEQGQYGDWDTGIKRVELSWVERSLINQQISGKHSFPSLYDLDLNWQYTYGHGTRESPDHRLYMFEEATEGTYVFPLRGDNNARIYEDMENDNHDFSTDLKFPLPVNQFKKTQLKSGFKMVDKSRESDIRRFQYENTGEIDPQLRVTDSLEEILNDEHIGPEEFQINDNTRPSDDYTADQTILAYYAMSDIRLNDYLGITGGVRFEGSDQELNTVDDDGKQIEPSLDTTDYFPSISGTWFVSGDKDTKLRLAFSETINRPDFKELSPASYTDPLTRLEVEGNPQLRETKIQNYDLRFEHFFSDSENIALSLFYKEFDQPIERIQSNSASQKSTFENSEKGENLGIEIEATKYLGFLHNVLSKYYVGGNFSWIDSEITLAEDQKGRLTNSNRAMQGQSDWMLNLNAGYENLNRGIVANLLFNMSGERISELGVEGLPDVKKQSVPRLDFVCSKEFENNWKLKFEAENLLNPEIEYEQGNQITRSFEMGRDFSLQVEYAFR